MDSYVLLPYEFLLEQNEVANVCRITTVLLPYEFLLEQNLSEVRKISQRVLLPYEFLLEQNGTFEESRLIPSFVTI